MSISLISVKCPECGATLNIEDDRRQAYCSYCGNKVLIHNENEHIYRHIDDAGVKKAETDHIIRIRELELEETRQQNRHLVNRVLTKIWIALSLIILLICVIKWVFFDGFFEGLLMFFYLGVPVIGGGAYLIFQYIPEKENEKVLVKNGGVRFPKSLEPFTEQNYVRVESALINAGFTNVSCLSLHDIKIGLLQKPNKIESITVNGEIITSGGKVYMPESRVVITYHGR